MRTSVSEAETLDSNEDFRSKRRSFFYFRNGSSGFQNEDFWSKQKCRRGSLFSAAIFNSETEVQT
jgi:hypothetical protein